MSNDRPSDSADDHEPFDEQPPGSDEQQSPDEPEYPEVIPVDDPPSTPPLKPPSSAPASPFVPVDSPFETSPFEKGSAVEEARGASFSLLHIFFWTFGIGLAMSVDNMAMMPTQQIAKTDGLEWMKFYMQSTRVITGLGMGPLIGMLPFWLIYRRQGVSFPYHPGHWLMMHYGMSFLVNVIGHWVQRATNTLPDFDRQMTEGPLVGMSSIYITATCSIAAGLVVAVLAFLDLKRDRPFWRIAFGVLVFQSGFALLGGIVTSIGFFVHEAMMWVGIMTMGMFSGCIAYIFFLMVIIALVMDVVEKNRRDWLHWMPFCLLILSILTSLVFLGVSIAVAA